MLLPYASSSCYCYKIFIALLPCQQLNRLGGQKKAEVSGFLRGKGVKNGPPSNCTRYLVPTIQILQGGGISPVMANYILEM